jgi:hypothetical protein
MASRLESLRYSRKDCLRYLPGDGTKAGFGDSFMLYSSHTMVPSFPYRGRFT